MYKKCPLSCEACYPGNLITYSNFFILRLAFLFSIVMFDVPSLTNNDITIIHQSKLNIQSSPKVLGTPGKTHAKGSYFILRYMYITKNFGIAVLTVLKVPPPPNNVDNEDTDKERWNQHCTGGRGRGGAKGREGVLKDCIVRKMRNFRVLLPKCPKTFGQNCSCVEETIS